MPASIIDGPLFRYGNMASILLGYFTGATAVADPNSDSGPDGVYQGTGFLDPRYWFQKDQVQGYKGKVPAHFQLPLYRSAGAIPAATATNNIAAAQNAVSGTAMTLAAASTGIAVNIPIIPYSVNINGNAPVTAAIALDFGFEFGNVTSGSSVITVANITDFFIGMPLVIAGVGNAAGTIPLLTYVTAVTAITAATPQITIAGTPLATNSATPIGTGNLWFPSGTIATPNFIVPTAALPFMAAGPSLLLDPRQSLARGVQIVGSSGAAGGNFLVSGWDIYNEPMTQLITVAAGASTGYSTKAFKYLASVTPQFTDAHNYTVGTSDTFGLHYYCYEWDDLDVNWASSTMTTSTGFTAGVQTSPATNLLGDVRGTIQVSGTGPLGSGVSSNVSNGSVSSLAMTGRRLTMSQMIPVHQATRTAADNPILTFGNTQA